MKNLLELFRKPANALEVGGASQLDVGEAARCPGCGRYVSARRLQGAQRVCPGCGFHLRLSARERIRLTVDPGSFTELFETVRAVDSLHFPGYSEKLERAGKASGEREGILCGRAKIGGVQTLFFAMEPGFMMASMGGAVGERLTRLFELASDEGLPVVGFCASGGARMQEGTQSLMQMAKVSGAVRWHDMRGCLYIAVLTDPTTGGVTASFAMLGDITLAEPGALVGFAGRRVVQQTTGKALPDDFQTAEAVLSAGFIDAIVPRTELRTTLGLLLKMHKGTVRI